MICSSDIFCLLGLRVNCCDDCWVDPLLLVDSLCKGFFIELDPVGLLGDLVPCDAFSLCSLHFGDAIGLPWENLDDDLGDIRWVALANGDWGFSLGCDRCDFGVPGMWGMLDDSAGLWLLMSAGLATIPTLFCCRLTGGGLVALIIAATACCFSVKFSLLDVIGTLGDI